MLNSLYFEGRMFCIVIAAAIYQLHFASHSSAIIVVPTSISRLINVSPCSLHCSSNQKYLKLRQCFSTEGFVSRDASPSIWTQVERFDRFFVYNFHANLKKMRVSAS